jgi:outer membrane receptor for ferrienterochelin and colicin
MKKYVLLAVTVLCLPLPARAVDLLAEIEAQEEEFIDEFAFLEDAGMIELASRHRQEIGMSPSAVTVLTREDVEASGATNIPDLLRLVPGMDVIIVTPSQTALTSRMHWTNTNDHYLVLVDGRDAVPELLGQMPWHVETVSLDDVERIEILRGPASSLYGASALAGVISITTLVVPEKTSASARMETGESGYTEAGIRGSTRLGDWGFSLSSTVGTMNSFSRPREQAKEFWKLRSMVEYRWSETERLALDFSASQGSGTLNTGSGLADIDYGIRALRLAYESQDIRGRLYWYNAPVSFSLKAPLEFGGIRLATYHPAELVGHTVDGELQWTLPEFFKELLLLVGGSGRAAYLGSDDLLDGETYADITSPRYHEPGVEHWEGRAAAFVHSEYKPSEWMTVTGTLRVDYNTVTGAFLSPRLVVVFKHQNNQYVRAGVGRGFLKPSYINSFLHPMAVFPDDSPIQGPAQENFQEFMSGLVGNPDLGNTELLSFEGGYLGNFLDGKLSVALDLFYNQLRKIAGMRAEMVADEQGLPDLDKSIVTVDSIMDVDIHGFELVVRYNPVESVALLASWAHRQVLELGTGHLSDNTPKNLVTLGGRFRTESGLVGSLYVFSRSEFWQAGVENPKGLMAPKLKLHSDNSFLILGKLGYRWKTTGSFELEMGVKLFLPFSPFSGPLFKYYEEAGGISPEGRYFGGEQLTRMLTGYLRGSF